MFRGYLDALNFKSERLLESAKIKKIPILASLQQQLLHLTST